MSFGQIVSILKARWWAALLIFVLTVGVTVAISLLLPKQYTANASVVADFKPDPVALISSGMASSGFMATQVDVITSERVALRVIRNLKLAENPQVRQQWLLETEGIGSIETWMVTFFQKQLEVKPSRESSVITVSYKAPDAGFAAAMANAFVQAYLQTALELRVEPAKQYSTFFDNRATEARDALEKAQSKLSAFQKENGIIASDERLDIENARLNELSSQTVMLQALASESGSRQVQARSDSADKMQEVLNNPLVSGLKADLSRAEAKLQELQARLGDNHPQVVEAKANISALRSKVDAEIRRVTSGVGVSNTITRQRVADVRASLEAQRNKVLRLKAVRDDGAVLMRDVESAQRAFEGVTQRLNQSSLESQNTQSNIHLLTAATAPLLASSPRVMLNTALAVVLGLMLAIGLALLLEMMDRRVRGVDDVAAALGLAVIGVLPKPTARALIGGNKPSLAQQRMVGRLAAPARGV
ncbi:MAG: chain length determinant protein EpsF [Rubrivivax sp.]